MTDEELDALEGRLSTFTQAEWGEAGMAIRMANSAIAALRRELYDAKHHAKARLVALRETETELQCAESEKDALRRELAAERERRIVYSPDALAMSDRVKQAEAERNAAIARAEKAELSVTEYELVRDVVLCDLGRDLNAAQAEVHELRELLREARPLLDCISKNSRLTTSRKLTGGHSKASTPRSRGRGKSDG